MEVNAYRGVGNSYAQRSTDNVGKGMAGLDVNDFMTLLSTQLANQDIMNPESDTQFIAQMAQFTSLQAMKSIADMAQTQYAASIVGKRVIVANFEPTGELNTDTGSVERIKFVDGESVATVNGEDYKLSSIMEILSDSEATETTETPETTETTETPETTETTETTETEDTETEA